MRVRAFYEEHPYPPASDDLSDQRVRWTDARRRAEWHLLFPHSRFDSAHRILVAGCGTAQAARYAARWPNAAVVGIDVSEASLTFEHALKERHCLENLELRQLPLERASELGSFDHIVCTGVLHHLEDPYAGLRALRETLTDDGAVHIMVYAPYGRAGIYLLQRYCAELGVGRSREDIEDLTAAMRALPPDHPIVPLLRTSPDFQTIEGIADALLHPLDRSYSVTQLFELLDACELHFERWTRQAPYLGSCGAIATTPHGPRIASLEPSTQYAAMERFRGTMTRHSVVASKRGGARKPLRFGESEWNEYVPIRLPETIEIRERLPHGASAVLINRAHTYTDLYLPITQREERVLSAVDGTRSIADIERRLGDTRVVHAFLKQLWNWDQVVFDARE